MQTLYGEPLVTRNTAAEKNQKAECKGTPIQKEAVKVNQAVGGPRKEREKLRFGLRGAES